MSKARSDSGERGTLFGAYRDRDVTPRPWLSALAGSSLLYVVIAAAVVWLALQQSPPLLEREVEITFIEPVPPPPPPPPPAAVVPAAPLPAPAAAPVVPPSLKVRRLEKPPPRKELVAPKEMPVAPPKEAEPAEDPGVAVVDGPGSGDPAGLEGGTASGVAGGEVGIIELPADAEAPVPLPSNAQPRYPSQAKRSNKVGVVVLRVIILADGSVSNVQLQNGDEPFASAAIRAVKQWHYRPARHKGVAISIYRNVIVRFELES